MSKLSAGLMVVGAVATLGVRSSAAADKVEKTIVEVAVAADHFKTLVTAVKAADLIETLSGKGPFTVFAPTDEAFKEVPKEVLADLLKPENKEKLAAVLTYHVVAGKVLAVESP